MYFPALVLWIGLRAGWGRNRWIRAPVVTPEARNAPGV
jgi:hypothetical protein